LGRVFASLKMLTAKYFSYIPSRTHNDGGKFLEEYGEKGAVAGG